MLNYRAIEEEYVIQRKKDNIWLLDIEEDIFAKSFLKATKFVDKQSAIDFMDKKKLNKSEYELFRLKVFAEPIYWKPKKCFKCDGKGELANVGFMKCDECNGTGYEIVKL